MDTPVLDEHGGDIPLDHYDIELAHVPLPTDRKMCCRM